MAKQKLYTSKIKYLDAFMQDILVHILPHLYISLSFNCIFVVLALYFVVHLFHYILTDEQSEFTQNWMYLRKLILTGSSN